LNALKPVVKKTDKTSFLREIIALKRIENRQRDIACENYRRNAKKHVN
jgi:hypothetical protein